LAVVMVLSGSFTIGLGGGGAIFRERLSFTAWRY
jgi:hypothetical protein